MQKMMIDGTVNVQGTVKIDKAKPFKKSYELKKDICR